MSATAAFTTAARADEPAGTQAAPAARPAFTMMDNTGDGSGVDLQLPLLFATHDGDGKLIRPRLAAQYISASGLGAYGIVHGADQFGVENPPGTSTTAFGNLELGALYHTALAPQLDLGARVGLAIPTANGGVPQAIDLTATALARPADFAAIAPGNWLRLGVSPTFHQGIGFARVDLGVDVPLTSRDQVGGDTLAHVNAGVGVALSNLVLTGELQTLIQVTGDQTINTLYTAGVAARYQIDRIAPYLAVSMPLGNDSTGDFLTVTAGVSVAL